MFQSHLLNNYLQNLSLNPPYTPCTFPILLQYPSVLPPSYSHIYGITTADHPARWVASFLRPLPQWLPWLDTYRHSWVWRLRKGIPSGRRTWLYHVLAPHRLSCGTIFRCNINMRLYVRWTLYPIYNMILIYVLILDTTHIGHDKTNWWAHPCNVMCRESL